MIKTRSRACEQSLFLPVRRTGRLVLRQPLLRLGKLLVGDDLQLGEVPQPFLALLFRARLLVEIARQRIAHVCGFTPRPDSDVLAVGQIPSDIVLMPVRS